MSHDGLSPTPEPRRRRLRPRRMIKVLPSMLTLGNLLCGFASIFYASRSAGQPHLFQNFSPLAIAAAAIFAGMIFDVLDGRVARMTRQTSELGEQLDSMADMVSFGVAPAFLIIQIIGIGTPFFGQEQADTIFDRAVLVIAGIYAACTALRLARFNVEIEQLSEADHMSFKGLPSPAAAGTVASLVILHQLRIDNTPFEQPFTIAMLAVALLAALAMVSTFRYTHLMNRYLRGRAPFQTIAGSVVVVIALLIFPHYAVAAGCTFYALSAPAAALLRRLQLHKSPAPVPLPSSQEQGEGEIPKLKIAK